MIKEKVLLFISTFVISSLSVLYSQNADGYHKIKYNKLKKHALVIGNETYNDSVILPVKQNVLLVSESLKKEKFELSTVIDAGYVKMKKTIDSFLMVLDSDSTSIGLFYYNGNGIISQGVNVLYPVDQKINSVEDLRNKTISMDYIYNFLQTLNNYCNIIILDMPRTDPFFDINNVHLNLHFVELPEKTFVFYSTSPGHPLFRSEGLTFNSYFAEEFSKAIRTPKISIEEVDRRIRRHLYETTNRYQVSWSRSSIKFEFYFE